MSNRKKTCSKRLKVAPQSQPPNGSSEELHDAALDKPYNGPFVAQSRLRSEIPQILQEQHSYMNNNQPKDQHHNHFGNNKISDSNGQSSALPIPNEINDLKNALEQEGQRNVIFQSSDKLWQKECTRFLKELKNAFTRSKNVPSNIWQHHTHQYFLKTIFSRHVILNQSIVCSVESFHSICLSYCVYMFLEVSIRILHHFVSETCVSSWSQNLFIKPWIRNEKFDDAAISRVWRGWCVLKPNFNSVQRIEKKMLQNIGASLPFSEPAQADKEEAFNVAGA